MIHTYIWAARLCTFLPKSQHSYLASYSCTVFFIYCSVISSEDEKIEWITVGTVTLRREFEAQARSLWSSLMASLQTSCRDDAAVLDSFMANATLMLENKAIPKNAKELAEISAKQQALRIKMPEVI